MPVHEEATGNKETSGRVWFWNSHRDDHHRGEDSVISVFVFCYEINRAVIINCLQKIEPLFSVSSCSLELESIDILFYETV